MLNIIYLFRFEALLTFMIVADSLLSMKEIKAIDITEGEYKQSHISLSHRGRAANPFIMLAIAVEFPAPWGIINYVHMCCFI